MDPSTSPRRTSPDRIRRVINVPFCQIGRAEVVAGLKAALLNSRDFSARSFKRDLVAALDLARRVAVMQQGLSVENAIHTLIGI